MSSLGGKARAGEVTLGVGSLCSQDFPLAGTGDPSPWGPSAPGCQLLGHCVQLSVSVSLFHLPRNFPSFSLSVSPSNEQTGETNVAR